MPLVEAEGTECILLSLSIGSISVSPHRRMVLLHAHLHLGGAYDKSKEKMVIQVYSELTFPPESIHSFPYRTQARLQVDWNSLMASSLWITSSHRYPNSLLQTPVRFAPISYSSIQASDKQKRIWNRSLGSNCKSFPPLNKFVEQSIS